MGTGLDVDLRHDAVDLHARHDPDEGVARAGTVLVSVTRVVRHRDREGGERLAGDLGGYGIGHRQQTLVDPATHRVVAHTEKTSGSRHTVRRHASIMPHARVVEAIQSRIRGFRAGRGSDPAASTSP